ncbi:hypothetical protein ACLOJK_041097 [Asimina triloba]
MSSFPWPKRPLSSLHEWEKKLPGLLRWVDHFSMGEELHFIGLISPPTRRTLSRLPRDARLLSAIVSVCSSGRPSSPADLPSIATGENDDFAVRRPRRHRICCRRLPICRPIVCLTVPSPPSLEMGFRGSHGCPSSLAHRTAGRLHLRPPAAAVAGGDRPNLSWSPPAIIVTEEEDGFSAFGFSIFAKWGDLNQRVLPVNLPGMDRPFGRHRRRSPPAAMAAGLGKKMEYRLGAPAVYWALVHMRWSLDH